MKGKKLKIITITLAIVLVCLVSFVGVYAQNKNMMENKVKDYSLGMDLKGSRILTLDVSTEKNTVVKDSDGKVIEDAKDEDIEANGYTQEEVAVNSDESLTVENYKKSKSIIEARLKSLGINDYTVRLDEATGKIVVELPEDENTDYIVSIISETGNFKMTDSEDTTNVLMTNDDVKTASVMYNSSTSGTTVYLDIKFDKDGTSKLANVSKDYKQLDTNTTTENTTTDENNTTTNETTDSSSTTETQKKVTMTLDDQTLISTYFGEEMTNGELQMSMGSATTDSATLQKTMKSATTVATLIDTGCLPVTYTLNENEYVATDLDNTFIAKIAIVLIAVITIALIALVIRFKGNGILSAISFIGFLGLYLLTLRYTNVVITLEGICGILLVVALNYIFNNNLLGKLKSEKSNSSKLINEKYVDFLVKIIPAVIICVVFCLIKWIPISSFGMTMFWGLVLILLYNIIVTKSLLRTTDK